MKQDDKSPMKSFIAIGFGSSDTGVNLYWSNDGLKTIEKYIHKQNTTNIEDQSELPDKKI